MRYHGMLLLFKNIFGLTVVENILLETANSFRRDRGLTDLAIDGTLTKAAENQAAYMAEIGRFTYYGPPPNGTLKQRLEQLGYNAEKSRQFGWKIEKNKSFDVKKELDSKFKSNGSLLIPEMAFMGIGSAESPDGRQFYSMVMAEAPQPRDQVNESPTEDDESMDNPDSHKTQNNNQVGNIPVEDNEVMEKPDSDKTQDNKNQVGQSPVEDDRPTEKPGSTEIRNDDEDNNLDGSDPKTLPKDSADLSPKDNTPDLNAVQEKKPYKMTTDQKKSAKLSEDPESLSSNDNLNIPKSKKDQTGKKNESGPEKPELEKPKSKEAAPSETNPKTPITPKTKDKSIPRTSSPHLNNLTKPQKNTLDLKSVISDLDTFERFLHASPFHTNHIGTEFMVDKSDEIKEIGEKAIKEIKKVAKETESDDESEEKEEKNEKDKEESDKEDKEEKDNDNKSSKLGVKKTSRRNEHLKEQLTGKKLEKLVQSSSPDQSSKENRFNRHHLKSSLADSQDVQNINNNTEENKPENKQKDEPKEKQKGEPQDDQKEKLQDKLEDDSQNNQKDKPQNDQSKDNGQKDPDEQKNDDQTDDKKKEDDQNKECKCPKDDEKKKEEEIGPEPSKQINKPQEQKIQPDDKNSASESRENKAPESGNKNQDNMNEDDEPVTKPQEELKNELGPPIKDKLNRNPNSNPKTPVMENKKHFLPPKSNLLDEMLLTEPEVLFTSEALPKISHPIDEGANGEYQRKEKEKKQKPDTEVNSTGDIEINPKKPKSKEQDEATQEKKLGDQNIDEKKSDVKQTKKSNGEKLNSSKSKKKSDLILKRKINHLVSSKNHKKTSDPSYLTTAGPSKKSHIKKTELECTLKKNKSSRFTGKLVSDKKKKKYLSDEMSSPTIETLKKNDPELFIEDYDQEKGGDNKLKDL